MEPRRRTLTHLGLRSQIVLALTVTFVLAFGLFSVALVRITQRARAEDRVSDLQAAAALLANALSQPSEDPREQFVQLSEALLGEAGVRGVELARERVPHVILRTPSESVADGNETIVLLEVGAPAQDDARGGR